MKIGGRNYEPTPNELKGIPSYHLGRKNPYEKPHKTESKKTREGEMKKTNNTCTHCGGKHVTAAHGAKNEAMKKSKKNHE